MAEQRTKEIGIRKVMGATIPKMIVLLSAEFTKLVIIANVIAWPCAYVLMRFFLQNFAYRTGISLWILFIAGVLTLMIAWITVGYQAIRAARANPVDSLRYE